MKARIEIGSATGLEYIVLDAENPQDHFDLGALCVGLNSDRFTLNQPVEGGNLRLRMAVDDLIRAAVERKGLSS